MRAILRLAALLCAVGLGLGAALPPAHIAAAPTPLPAAAPHALTHDDLEAYLDGFFPDAMARADIAGAVVVVVKDGHVLLEKGYGYADIDSRKPVDPARTLFRPGSISKLFTWTAVMQLVEKKQLDLDHDVNDYLDFKIPEAFGKPITLRNLMTHTSGFEEHIKGLMVDDPARLLTLRDALVNGMPARIYPPGEVSAYSNYGASLAGYIVQRTSGEAFENYVAHHIFQPLKMEHSTFVQPLPAALASDMSKGYYVPEGKPQSFEFISMRPAGALTATADDMAHFMIAHLDNGSYDSVKILQPETAMLMHRAAFQPTPPLAAMALGFYHEDRNGHPIVGHGGDTQVFHSDLHLILDQNVGLFVSLNSAGHETSLVDNLRTFLLDHFMDRYFPGPAPTLATPLASAPADAKAVAGAYIVSRRSDSNFFSVARIAQPIEIVADKDGSLSLPALAAAGGVKKWIEVAPFVWREEHGTRRLVARLQDGHVRWVSSELFPPILVLQPVSFWQSAIFVLSLLGASVLMLALTVVFWPIKAILRWRYSQPFALSGRAALLYRLTRIFALIDVVAIGGWAAFLLSGQLRLSVFDAQSDGLVRILQLLSIMAIAGTIVPIIEFGTALRDPNRIWWTKFTDGLIVTASLALAWFLINYNFITVSTNY